MLSCVAPPIMEVSVMTSETIRKLREMRFAEFARAYEEQIEKPEIYAEMTFDERLSILVDREHDAKHNRHIKRLVTQASLPSTSAFLSDIEYLPDRHLDRDLIRNLSTNEYIRKKRNLIILGATGSGKTFLANAFGINACYAGLAACYVRLPDLFIQYSLEEERGRSMEMLKKIGRYALLIIDEFLLVETNEAQQRILLEIMERRMNRGAIILCSQIGIDGWHSRLGGGLLADSILDRIIHGAYKIKIDGKTSMRQRHAEER